MSRRRTSSTPRTPSLRPSTAEHIILEKPMALMLEDCDAIITAVERAGVHLIVGHTPRPSIRRCG